MNHKQISERVCTIIAEAFSEIPNEKFTENLETPFTDYVQLQSIHAMAITSMLEDEFDVELDAEEFMQCKCVAEAVKYVETEVVPEDEPADEEAEEAPVAEAATETVEAAPAPVAASDDDDDELGFCEDDDLLYKMFPNIR